MLPQSLQGITPHTHTHTPRHLGLLRRPSPSHPPAWPEAPLLWPQRGQLTRTPWLARLTPPFWRAGEMAGIALKLPRRGRRKMEPAAALG